MNIPMMIRRTALVSAWILFHGLAIAQQDQLSLRHGTYVLTSVACKDAPFAAIMAWDGEAFSGPHSSKCRSSVQHHGNQFTVSTTCDALGDGTPDRSKYVDTFELTRLSSISFSIARNEQPQTIYRFCSATKKNVQEKP